MILIATTVNVLAFWFHKGENQEITDLVSWAHVFKSS